MKEKIKVLILEDLPSDAELAEREVKAVLKNYTAVVTDTEQGFIKALENFKPDLIISDYMLPAFNGMKALQITRKKEQFIPFIILTGSLNEETAVECIKAGADDYVIKEHIKRLGPAILNALDKKKNRQERKRAEDKLKVADDALHSSVNGVIISDLEGKIKYANPAFINLFEYEGREQVLGKDAASLFPSADIHKFSDVEAIINKTKGETEELIARLKDGTEIQVEVSYSVLTDKEGNETGRMASFIDITERKQAEILLAKSERRYRLLADNLSDVIWTRDLDFKLTYISPSTYQQTGFSIAEKMSKPFEESVTPESAAKIYKVLKEELALEKSGKADPGRSRTLEIEMRHKNGSTVPVEITVSFLRDKAGAATGLIGVNRNITERKQAEKELTKLSTAVKQSPSVIAITDTEGNLEYVNPKFTELTGYNLEEAIGQNPRVLKSGEQADEIYKELWETISSGKIWRGEFHNKKKSGELFWEFASISPIFNKQGKIINYIKVAEDITDRKKAEQELKESEEKYRMIVENAHDGIEITQNDRMIFFNNQFAQMLGYKREELKEVKFSKIFSEQAKKELYQRQKKREQGNTLPPYYETTFVKKDGTVINVGVKYEIIDYKGEQATFSIIRDITESKQAKDQIQNDLKEKTILLSEVHHRVKNSLQLVASLLQLQSREITEKHILDLFQQSRNRIKMMAGVYEKLYQSKNFASIDYKEYLEDVLNNLYRSSNISHRVSLKLEIKNVVLGLDDATPVALIINELFTNSLKHAFPGERKGKIEIYFNLLDEETYQLIYRDNGVGLSGEVDLETTRTLGLRLIYNLAKQINGEASLEQNGWTTFTIKFRGYGYGKIKYSDS
ncbi:PAS domain S-box protein [candidate division KSB1 bacterium]|nr:PAS domain S-box protein [candidate division KSB1 bacterium]